MSSLGGAAGIALALIAEEVIVTSQGGPTAIVGFFGSAARVLDHIADPLYPGIPDLTKAKTPTPAPTAPGIGGNGITTAPNTPQNANPLQAPPPGASGPVRDYNPNQLAPQGFA